MSKSLLLFGLAGISVLFACKHAVPYPEISNNPIVSLNCSSDTVYFQNEILPILTSNCAMSGCHDSQSAQDGIVLTDYVSIMNSDVIERGKPNKSELVEVLTESGEDLMPPSPYNALSSDMISKIEKWISQDIKNNQEWYLYELRQALYTRWYDKSEYHKTMLNRDPLINQATAFLMNPERINKIVNPK